MFQNAPHLVGKCIPGSLAPPNITRSFLTFGLSAIWGRDGVRVCQRCVQTPTLPQAVPSHHHLRFLTEVAFTSKTLSIRLGPKNSYKWGEVTLNPDRK